LIGSILRPFGDEHGDAILQRVEAATALAEKIFGIVIHEEKPAQTGRAGKSIQLIRIEDGHLNYSATAGTGCGFTRPTKACAIWSPVPVFAYS
jgi:hypothetical protein